MPMMRTYHATIQYRNAASLGTLMLDVQARSMDDAHGVAEAAFKRARPRAKRIDSINLVPGALCPVTIPAEALEQLLSAAGYGVNWAEDEIENGENPGETVNVKAWQSAIQTAETAMHGGAAAR